METNGPTFNFFILFYFIFSPKFDFGEKGQGRPRKIKGRGVTCSPSAKFFLTEAYMMSEREPRMHHMVLGQGDFWVYMMSLGSRSENPTLKFLGPPEKKK